MLNRSTIQLLRLHFSFFLLPVFLFALSQANGINWPPTLLAFSILHLLVYPASNGYNSYMDRDEGPIGGLKNPMQPTRQLFAATIILDGLAIALSMFISWKFSTGILVYILASRAYSYRGIRLKRFPVLGFLIVFIFQGAWIYQLSFFAITGGWGSWLPCSISSLLIGALYPLSQVYQHEEDRQDGVTTISMLLGKKGSFIFSMLLFLSAVGGIYLLYRGGNIFPFYLFLIVTSPVVLFFLFWMRKVWIDEKAANFKHSLQMNIIATLCTSCFFIILIFQR